MSNLKAWQQALEALEQMPGYDWNKNYCETASELRRQHEEITELRHAAGVANQVIVTLQIQRDAFLKESAERFARSSTEKEICAWTGHDLDGMVEAFSRVIEAHHNKANPFHNPIDMDAQMALRTLRGFIPAMKAYTDPSKAERKGDYEGAAWVAELVQVPVQEPLGAEFSRVLHENLWDLYERQLIDDNISISAELEQEPVAWIHGDEYGDVCHWVGGRMPPAGTKLYAALAEQEPVHQFRKQYCANWYDGHPDHTDGGGPYEERTLYLAPPQRLRLADEEIRAALEAEFIGCGEKRNWNDDLRVSRAIEKMIRGEKE